MRQINIAYKCQLRPDGRWAPAFELTLIGDGEICALPIMSAADAELTFTTKEEAEAASDATARKWCVENYPGWPIQPA